jgi:hypothetical protein
LRSIEEVKALQNALVAYYEANGRFHEEKPPLQQQCDDLAGILFMKLCVLEKQMQGGGRPDEPRADEQLTTLLTDLAVLASSGAITEALGGSGSKQLLETMKTVKSAGQNQYEEGLRQIDKGNALRAEGETSSRLDIMRQQQQLLDKKLDKG